MRLAYFLNTAIAMAAPGFQWSNLPLSFEPNTGQPASQVRYLARGSAYTLYFAPTEIVLTKQSQRPLRTRLAGANPSARIAGEDQQPSKSNYFVGKDSNQWRTGVPNFSRVRYSAVYPGIDLVYYGADGHLEYDWIVSAGADPRSIRMVFDGADRVRIGKRGDLFVKLGSFEYCHARPVVYQESAGKRVQVAGSWTVHGKEAGFRVDAYDHARALTIDPMLLYSTYQGGSGLDVAYAVAVDSAGSTYATGGAGPTDFTTTSASDGQSDAFVIKLNVAGTARIYSTYLGGNGVDEGHGIAIDSDGNVYVTGSAGSTDFPRSGAIQSTYGGSGDAFIAKIDPTGSRLVYSTYLGGTAQDNGTAIAVDPAGNAYVVGVTFSTNFPTVNPFQATKGSQQDAFVAKINPAGTAYLYSTYLGGNDVDEGYAIACDAAGNAYVTGYTASSNFPLQSPIRSSNLNSVDAFVTKLNPAGSALVFSTYLGGSATDYATAIAVDSTGVYVGGIAISGDFPMVNAFQPKLSGTGVSDAFVTKFNPSGTSLAYSTYLGGTGADEVHALAVDQNGHAWVTGRTNSSDFPVVNPIQSTRKAAFDIFVAEVNAAGNALLFSSYLGGSGSEYGWGIAVDRASNVHVVGETTSTDFPTRSPIQSQFGGGLKDGFVLLIGDSQLSLKPPGDSDGNGVPDVFLQFPDGSMGVWYLGANQRQLPITGFAFLSGPSSGIELVNVADLNGDGAPDLILRFTDGSIGVWYMGGPQNTTITGFALISGPVQGWRPAGMADLDHDGHPDMIVQNDDGSTEIWFLGGSGGNQIQSSVPISGPINGWTLVGMADLDNDGHPDAIIQYTDGSLGAWYLGGAQGNQIIGFALTSGPSPWSVVGTADMDGDGHPDLLIRNSDGTLGVWYLGGANGNAITGFTPITTLGSLDWKEFGVH